MLISEILKEKGNNVYTISPDKTVYEAISELTDKNVGALVVQNGENDVVGMFSERDYTSKVILKGRHSQDTKVRDVMSPKVQFVTPEQSIEECMALMTEKRFRHFPVLNERHLIGIVSIGDLVKAIISKQKIEIDYLMNYITGKYPV